MRGTEPNGNPFQFIAGNVRHFCVDSEIRNDFEGAIEELRHAARLLDAIGLKMGEADARKGNVRNVAMTLRGAASNAERAWAKVQAGDLSRATGLRIRWQDVREHGLQIAYDAARKAARGQADEDYWL